MPSLLYILPPLLLAVYYAVLIAKKQRSPEPGPVVVRYEPPDDLTPAAARYVWKGCVDQRTVASVFAGLATKGRIALHRNSHAYKITKLTAPGSAPGLNQEEQGMMDWLFSNFLDSATFNPGQSANGCISSLRGGLDRRLRGEYQSLRFGWAALGMFTSLVVSILMAYGIGEGSGSTLQFTYVFFMASFMTGVVVAALLVPAVADLLRGLGNVPRVVMAVAITAFPLAVCVGLFFKLGRDVPGEFGAMLAVLVAMNIAAVPLLRSVTPKGIEAQRQIAGFREYLEAVEQDPLDRLVKPNTPPPSSASLLSYAIALEVKEGWGDDMVNACYLG